MDIREFKLERYFAEHEFSAKYLLSSSDCESLSIRDLLLLEDEPSDIFSDLRLGYTESQGSPALRDEIARWYDSISPENIVVTSGAEEAIFISMQVLLRDGDDVIVQTPAYQSLQEIPRSIGCRVIPWEMKGKGGKWILDPDLLSELITPATRLLVVNSPHNPTGYQFTHKEWDTIREICEGHRIAILSDEVYRGAEHSSHSRLPAMADRYDLGYSIGVMSKAFGLAGLRIGWVASPDPIFIRKFLAFKDYTTICNSGPSEYLAMVALRQRDKILNRNRGIISKNLTILNDFMIRNKELITWSRPDAGSTAFPRLIKDVSVELFCRDVLDGSGVLLLPGTVFDVISPHFRIGYGRDNFPLVLSVFEKYLEHVPYS